MNFKKYTVFLFTLLLWEGCSKGVQDQQLVYSNNFESSDLNFIQGGVVSDYNGTNVLGNYNNDGFSLRLNNLKEHDLVEISFDLYIHDSWDGNESTSAGPDLWQMKLAGDKVIHTTFSNYKCESGFCLPQSYPHNYPNFNNNPRNGAFRINLSGFCPSTRTTSTTSLYKIKKTISHTGSSLMLECVDMLKQEHLADVKCDESWSVDNLLIKAVSLK